MTILLAIVRSWDEALVAVASGADQAAVLGGSAPNAGGRADWGRIGRMIWPPPDAIAPCSLQDEGDGPLWLPLSEPWQSAIHAAVQSGRHVVGWLPPDAGERGFAVARTLRLEEVLVATEPFAGHRLLDACSIADLERQVARARAAGLRVGFVGALEGPDVPRLRALTPDVIGFETSLRDPQGRFDPGRLNALCALLSEGAVPAELEAWSPTDRIFVRDWIVPMFIGAYAREHGRPQRVRFTVEAVVRPAAGAPGLAGVVSYDLITDAITRLSARHVDLVEELADGLADIVLASPRVLTLDITVEKLDVGPGSVGCRIFRRRRATV